MTRRRWIADEVSGNRAFLVGAHADHLVRVLRARVGQEFDITTGSEVRRGRLTAISPDRVEFELGEQIPISPNVQITLLLSIFKFDRMEWAIEKCTELGVARIVPLMSRRTEARWQHRLRNESSAGDASYCRLQNNLGAAWSRKFASRSN